MSANIKIIEKDLGWKNIKKQFKKTKGIKIEIGLWGEGNNSKQNMAHRGAIHQFGSPELNIPKRPFMSVAFDSSLKSNIKFIKNEFRKVVDQKQKVNQVFKKIGVLHEGQIKEKIISGNWIANAPWTIAKKKSSRPLIDTGVMRTSVKYKIEKGI